MKSTRNQKSSQTHIYIYIYIYIYILIFKCFQLKKLNINPPYHLKYFDKKIDYFCGQIFSQ